MASTGRFASRLAFLLLAFSILWSGFFLVLGPPPSSSTLVQDLLDFRVGGAPPHGRSNNIVAYTTNVICRGCVHAMADEQNRCGFLIQQHVQAGMSRLQGMQKVTSEFPNTCGGYCTSTCSDTDRQYWGYDRVISVQKAWSFMLPSVPKDHRIPTHAVSNLTAYFLSSPEHVIPKATYLADYNPSLVQLPVSQRTESAVYLASFRVSNQQFCMHPGERKLMSGGQQLLAKNYLGLALLDEDLNIIKDAVFDPKKAKFPAAEDFRLFVMNDQLYLSSYDLIAPLWLSPHPNAVQLPIVFGDWDVFVRDFPSCAPCARPRGVCGKNFNYFTDSTKRTMMEFWPSPPHVVRAVNLDTPCDRNKEPQQFVTQSSARPTFATTEEIDFAALSASQVLLTRGRGGACCIPVEHKGRSHLVGIDHSKTPSQGKSRLPAGNITDNHYLSRFTAFESTEPYQIVAQSGFFCLGFPQGSELDDVPLARATLWRKLVLGQSFDCPRIHFVSGMTLKADDPSQALITYGINDCVSRMVQVPVATIERLLFEGPQAQS